MHAGSYDYSLHDRVTYYRENPPLWYKPYKYAKLHKPTDKTFAGCVYCHSEHDFVELLRHWSCGVWVFYPLDND